LSIRNVKKSIWLPLLAAAVLLVVVACGGAGPEAAENQQASPGSSEGVSVT
jgi:hypothetical protein